MMDRLVEQMKEQQRVTEELKMPGQMAWVRQMNIFRAWCGGICAEKVCLWIRMNKNKFTIQQGQKVR